ncbi:MAG: hypothetical protein K6C36_09870, partial [Clostridia bacterium]|nr:hypothetical protein [Clostridia bacterium]
AVVEKQSRKGVAPCQQGQHEYHNSAQTEKTCVKLNKTDTAGNKTAALFFTAQTQYDQLLTPGLPRTLFNRNTNKPYYYIIVYNDRFVNSLRTFFIIKNNTDTIYPV